MGKQHVEITSRFNENLDRAIKDKKISRNKLKEMSGVSLERYKDGAKMREPTISSAVRIADALGVSLDDLCGRNAFVKDFSNISVAEYLRLVELLENFGANLSDDGTTLRLPRSNATTILQQVNGYAKAYAKLQRLDPKLCPDGVSDARSEWLNKQIKELEPKNEPFCIAASEPIQQNTP